MQISARELRVMALQHHLHVHVGIEPWREKVAKLLKWLPDYNMVPGRGDAAKERWVLSVYDRLVRSPRYSLASFRAEWERRNALLAKRRKRRPVYVEVHAKGA